MAVLRSGRVVTVTAVSIGAARMGLCKARSKHDDDGDDCFHVVSLISHGPRGCGFQRKLQMCCIVASFTVPGIGVIIFDKVISLVKMAL